VKIVSNFTLELFSLFMFQFIEGHDHKSLRYCYFYAFIIQQITVFRKKVLLPIFAVFSLCQSSIIFSYYVRIYTVKTGKKPEPDDSSPREEKEYFYHFLLLHFSKKEKEKIEKLRCFRCRMLCAIMLHTQT
jgi:hypothetical protein